MMIRKTLPGVLAVLVLLATVVVAGRGGAGQAVRAIQPKGKLLLSVRILEGALTGPVKGDSGFFFYIEDDQSYLADDITGHEMRDGKVVDVFGGGTSWTQDFMTGIEAVHFTAFDFAQELKRVEDAHGPQAVVADGAKFEIRFVHKDVDFRLVAWNPMPTISGAAQYSPAIAKLKALLDVVALHYGRLKLF